MRQKLNGPKCLLVIGACLILCSSAVDVQARRARRHRSRAQVVKDQSPEREDTSPEFEGVRLKLVDGTYLKVDEAWESEQGIWYRQGGITHLLSKDRVKAIERAEARKPEIEPTVAVVKEPASDSKAVEDGPAWIYLKGGARVEADAATESAAGVWYRHGSMSIFLERLRIDHIERELENLAKSDSNAGKERGWSSGNQRIDGLIRQNGTKFGVDPYLIFCVMEQESHFNSRAVSPKGARGLMQLMPGTGRRFGVRRPHDPGQNIAGGTRYLKQLLTQFGGRVDLVLASYNAGEGAVIKYGHRVPPYRETRDYVKRISYKYRRAKQPVTVPATSNTAGNL